MKEVVTIFIAVIFIMIGVLILMGRIDGLIAGYNTMDNEERKQVNVGRLRKIVAIMLFAVSILMAVLYYMTELHCSKTAQMVAVGIFLLLLVIGCVVANKWCIKKKV